MRILPVVLASLLAATAVPLVAQANHDDGWTVVTSTDFDAEHPPIVGVPSEMNYYALDAGEITGHHNAIVRFVNGPVTLVELPFTHEHDSMFSALVTPAQPGRFWGHVELPALDHAEHGAAAPESLATGHMEGLAIPLEPTAVATLSVEGALEAFRPSTLTFRLQDQDGSPLTGYLLATITVEDFVAYDGQPSLQVKLAVKEGTARLTFYPGPHPFQLHATAWPSIFSGPHFAPVTVEQRHEPAPAAPAPGAGPMLPEPEQVLSDFSIVPMETGHAHDGVRLHISQDPAPMNWVGQTSRTNLLLLDPDMRPVRHVDYTLRVTDELGNVWFETDALHEIDGIAQVDQLYPLPGYYRAEATATTMDGTKVTGERWFDVRPIGTNVVPAAIAVRAPAGLEVGVPAEFTIGLHRLATGESVPHTDYWVHVRHEGRDVFHTKIHSHEGDTTPWLAAPWPGAYEVRILSFAQSGGFVGTFADVRQLSAEGVLPLPEPLQAAGDDEPPRTTPGPAALGLLVVLGVALVAARPRRPSA